MLPYFHAFLCFLIMGISFVLTSYNLFPLLVPIHGTTLKICPGSHVGGHGLLKSLVDVAGRCLPLADALKPLPHMKVSSIVTLAVDIGIEKSALREVKFCCGSNCIDFALPRYICKEWCICRQ